MMKRFITILGVVLIILILTSSSAVAPYADHYEPAYSSNVTSPTYAVGAPGGGDATIGVNPSTLGVLVLDLGTNPNNWMDPNQAFTVYGYSGVNNINETYNISVMTDGMTHRAGPWDGYDSANLSFTTPSNPQAVKWRYFEINGTSGFTSGTNLDDTIYGPEIDAVGW